MSQLKNKTEKMTPGMAESCEFWPSRGSKEEFNNRTIPTARNNLFKHNILLGCLDIACCSGGDMLRSKSYIPSDL